MSALVDRLARLAMEPPFRIFARWLLSVLPVSARTRALWELSRRPAYLVGMYEAARQALRQGVSAMAVLEFGVAGGEGLLSMQSDAVVVERYTGVQIRVYGFDMGASGLPQFIGDHRDNPEFWRPGDFPMDEAALRPRLSERTTLILGNVRDTVPRFFKEHSPPHIGFVAFDLDLYSSTRDALAVFRNPDMRMLSHVPVYFDDIERVFAHRFAGELLAIDEFNAQRDRVKIDRWYGVKNGRPFPEREFLDKMFVAHDLEAAGHVVLDRDVRVLPLRA